mmetsp:Transcript_21714/g.60442  ORF Transcript_21714/g.60442 Transcript_21714/m.60442 type:complete len:219 (+) Transcript_21714:225-881(+)
MPAAAGDFLRRWSETHNHHACACWHRRFCQRKWNCQPPGIITAMDRTMPKLDDSIITDARIFDSANAFAARVWHAASDHGRSYHLALDRSHQTYLPTIVDPQEAQVWIPQTQTVQRWSQDLPSPSCQGQSAVVWCLTTLFTTNDGGVVVVVQDGMSHMYGMRVVQIGAVQTLRVTLSLSLSLSRDKDKEMIAPPHRQVEWNGPRRNGPRRNGCKQRCL